uniref:DDE Tnp4 domain-containing protein n=1 Tax=Eptatretus burgeri TaxID=7764 RepID=A0A8C4WX70_EPTBU
MNVDVQDSDVVVEVTSRNKTVGHEPCKMSLCRKRPNTARSSTTKLLSENKMAMMKKCTDRMRRVKALSTAALAVVLVRRRRRAGRKKRLWVKCWGERRPAEGAINNLLGQASADGELCYADFQRIHPTLFDELVERVGPRIARTNTTFRCAISTAERVAITLRFLTTGETYRSLSYQFRVGETTIGKIVPETCQAIYDLLRDEYMKCPTTSEQWKAVADGFQKQWNFPNCLGALDGKHILIKAPVHSGSKYFNCKYSSIVLMALVDSEHKFLFCDVWYNGCVSDGSVFTETTLEKALEERTANLPEPASFPGDDRPINFAIAADEAFPLKEYLMKPYSHINPSQKTRVFNYRISRARRVVENAFGIMANRFRVLLSPMGIAPDKVEKVLMASCALHNFLRHRAPSTYMSVADSENDITHAVTPGVWHDDPVLSQASLPRITNPSNRAKEQRDYICSYVNSHTGAVPWQWHMI